jgi:hypothetical protein
MMRRRQVALFLFLLAGMVLWLTYSIWLPRILFQLPWTQDRPDLFQALGTIVSLSLLVVNGVLACFLWLSWRIRKRERRWHQDVLRSTTPQRLRETLGRGGRVNWIDRGAPYTTDLRTFRRLAIVGRTGLGKTREAVELTSPARRSGC